MSFRGRFSSRFIKSGNYQKPKKTSYNDRGHSLRRHHPSERHGRPYSGSRGDSGDRFYKRDFTSEHFRERGFNKHDTRPNRSRYARGKHVDHDRDFKSSMHRRRGDFSLDKNTVVCGDIMEGDEFLVLNDVDDPELQFPIESIGLSEDDEAHDICERHFEREMSPLIIHRNFEKEYFRSDSEENLLKSRSRSPPVMRPGSLIKNYRERSSSRSLKSEFSFKRSYSRSRSHDKNSHYYQRSHSRSGRKEENCEERERRDASDSLFLIQQQIRYEKKRQKFLERQKTLREKRSELSVDHFLNECKKSSERRSKSSSYRSLEHKKDRYSRLKELTVSENKSPSPHNQQLKTGGSLSELKTGNSAHEHSTPDLYIETSKINIEDNFDEADMELSPISQAGSLNNKDVLHENNEHREDRFNLSPISQAGSFDKTEFSLGKKSCFEDKLDLSPISQNGSFDHDSTNEKPHESELVLSPISQTSSYGDKVSHGLDSINDNKLDLSPISQAGSFEKREFSQDQVLSPISLTGSLEYKCKLSDRENDNERPKSTDSMQQFLEEFRYSDRSRSSSPLPNVDNKGKSTSVLSKNNDKHNRHEPYSRYKKEYSTDDNVYVHKPLNKNSTSQTSEIGRIKYAVEENKASNKHRPFSSNTNTKNNFQKYVSDKPYEDRYQEIHIKNQEEQQINFPVTKHSNIDRNVQHEINCQNKWFQDNNQLYERRSFDTEYEKSQGNLEISAPQQEYQRTNQEFPYIEHFDQSKLGLYNQTPARFQNLKKTNCQSNVQESFLRQTPTELSRNINQQQAFKSTQFNDFLGRPVDTAIKTTNYEQSIQNSQVHHSSTDIINTRQSYEMFNKQLQYQQTAKCAEQMSIQQKYNEFPMQNMAPNSFSSSTNHNIPYHLSERLITNTLPSQPTFNIGHCGEIHENSIKNVQSVQVDKYPAQTNQSVSSWNLNKKCLNNQSDNLNQGYGKLGDNVSSNPFCANFAVNQINKYGITNQTPPFFHGSIRKNDVPTNIPQRQVLNAPAGYVTPYSNQTIIQDIGKLLPALQFQQNVASAQHLNQFGIPFIRGPPPVPHIHQTLESAVNSNRSINEGLDRPYPTHNFQKLPVNTIKGSLFHSGFNKQTEHLQQPKLQDQHTFPTGTQRPVGYLSFQQNIQTNSAEFQQGNNIFQEPIGANRNPKDFFLKNQESNFSQTVELQNEFNQPDVNLTPIDIKLYLNGTFKPGYKSVLGLSSERESRNHPIGLTHSNPECECVPNPEFVMRYKDTPPSPEELGVILDKFVIFFDVQQNSELEKDPFIVIQDSFSKSNRFGKLDVEEQSSQVSNPIFQPPSKPTCVLRWKGVMLAKAEGSTEEDARHKASISLINALAQTCYTVQTKYSYYCSGKLPKFMLKIQEKVGVYKMVKRDEIITATTETLKKLREYGLGILYAGIKGVDATHINVVLNLINDFFSDERNQCELIFGGQGPMEYTLEDLQIISKHVSKFDHLQWRYIKGVGRGTYTAVSRKFTPQHLCSYLLSINDSSIRYKLLPPQGPRINLLMPNCQYNHNIIKSIIHNPNQFGSVNTQPSKRPTPFRGGMRGRGAKRGKWA